MLYNKWRPAVFADVCGQPHITKTLLAQLKAGRLAHAYLFTGSRGTGKTTCAKILARAVNCRLYALSNGEPYGGEPCNICPSCLGILNNSSPDFSEIDAASNSGVDNIRALREELIYSPVASNKRVYIIDEVHMLSAGAFNALLKTLEEPPEHVLFILATTETHKVPATIISRCQRFAFRRIAKSVIIERLIHICEIENISAQTAALELLAQMADGSLRDALSLLEQCSDVGNGELTERSVRETLGLTGLMELAVWLNEIEDLQKSMGHLDRLYQAGMDVTAILGQLSTLLRDLLMGQLSGDLSVTRLPPDESEKLTKKWPRERIMKALSHITETRLSRSMSKKLEAELCLIRLACLEMNEIPKNGKCVQAEGKESSKQCLPPNEPAPKQEPLPQKIKEEPVNPGPETNEKRETELREAERDPQWAKLLESLKDGPIKDALKRSGARVEGDTLVIQTDDPFILGVLKQAEKKIVSFFPGGIGEKSPKSSKSVDLDALIASAGVPIIEE